MIISQLFIQLPLYLLVLPLPLPPQLSSSILKVEAAEGNPNIVAKPGCNYTCGNVIIPFPFGMGVKCFYDHWFEIDCKAQTNSNGSMVKPFLSKFNFEVLEVSIGYRSDMSLKVNIPPMNVCSSSSLGTHRRLNLSGSPYYFSIYDNVFMMEGCPGSAVLADQSKKIIAGCATACGNDSNNSAIQTNNCYGVHCCQTPLPYQSSPFQFYQIDFNNQSLGEGKNCLVATIIESRSVIEYVGKLSSSDPFSRVIPAILLWNWTSNFKPGNSHATCYSLGCSCKDGYYGNPYLSNGCQVAQECKDCQGYCFGEWDMTGKLLRPNSYWCHNNPVSKLGPILGFSISFGIVLSVIGLYGFYRFIKKRREMKRKAKFFKRNGGLLLQQQLSSTNGVVEKTRIFSMSELDKATDHFNENRILGQGGQGTVYKGMLTNGSIVAIKKSKLLDERQLEQFINEVVILSQLNHRNVVTLLGCCLETEVPLLVYEFVPNGTLFQHIHDPDEDFVITWEMCLKIATDSAAAVAYLHSAASIPIFHRDIKSSNILLDEKHRAKVSDFGSSKTIAIDQTHMTTLVQGTLGYLDPEYFQSYQFTEKSDVYSFGVVLLELLTRKKPIFMDGSSMEQKNLVTEFLFMTENSRMSEIMDPKIVREAKEDELIAVVELAKRCISWRGKLRPTMKEVAMTLEMIIKSPAQVSTWYQQQECNFPVPDEGFDEYVMGEICDAEMLTHPLSSDDAHPLLPDTI